LLDRFVFSVIYKRRKIINTKSNYLFLFVLLVFSLTACGTPAPAAADPATVVQGFWDAMNAKNIDAAMAFVADDVQTRGGPFNFENKAAFNAFLLSGSIQQTTFEVSDLKAASEGTVTYTMKVSDYGSTVANGPSKSQVKDGKLVYIGFP
jgi:ketosteroid isomerase-like protein